MGSGDHISVMLDEVMKYLQVEKEEKYIDATVGGGGYTEAILKKGGKVLGLDQDPISIEVSKKRLQLACPNSFYKLVNTNFTQLLKVASENGFEAVDGVVFDLGFASFQMDSQERGLSFSQDGPLDMRLDPNLGVTAADLVNSLPEKSLYELFKTVGEEQHSRTISRSIVSQRSVKPFATTKELKELIERVCGSKRVGYIHPATKVFMALRIAVNSELENLKEALPQAVELLKKDGRIIVVSFHSGEDAIVKHFFKDREKMGKLKVMTQKPLRPTEEEIQRNPRSRSALFRVVTKI